MTINRIASGIHFHSPVSLPQGHQVYRLGAIVSLVALSIFLYLLPSIFRRIEQWNARHLSGRPSYEGDGVAEMLARPPSAQVEPPIEKDKILAALREIPSPSFVSRLKGFFDNYCHYSEEVRRPLAVLDLFQKAYIDESDCQAKVQWEECLDICQDAKELPLQGGSYIPRHDCINDIRHTAHPSSFVTLVSNTPPETLSTIKNALITGNHSLLERLEVEALNVDIFYGQLSELTISIFSRYEDAVSCSPPISVKDFIYQHLKTLFTREAESSSFPSDLAVLQEETFSFTICQELVLFLLTNAIVEESQLKLRSGHTLSFSPILEITQMDFLQTSLYPNNDLCSQSITEEIYVTDHALEIAKAFRGDAELNEEKFREFILWMRHHYYYPFCASLQKRLTTIAQSTPLNTRPGLINNLDFGETFERELRRRFTIHSVHASLGNCFLASVLYDRPSANCGNLRQDIVNYMRENWRTLTPFIVVVPNFQKLIQVAQAQLLHEHWIIVEENNPEAKRVAILARAQKLSQSETFLKGPEFAIAADILQRPIVIFKKRASTFFIEQDTGKITPHFVCGEKYRGKPIHVIDAGDHYNPITPLDGRYAWHSP